jgi:ABC-type dipeptide/oligopeptide/nickel transport system permease subunit
MASWGTMLHDASNVRVFADFPWLLSPAAAMFLVVFALNLLLERAGVRLTAFAEATAVKKPDTTYGSRSS